MEDMNEFQIEFVEFHSNLYALALKIFENNFVMIMCVLFILGSKLAVNHEDSD